MSPTRAPDSSVGRQPGVEIGHALEIEQGLGQGLQPFQWQAANHVFLLRAQGAAAAAQQAQGDLGFSLGFSWASPKAIPRASPRPKISR